MPGPQKTVENFYAAVNQGRIDETGALLDADVRWHRPPDVPISGTVEGAGGVAKMWRAFAGSLESSEIVPTRFEIHGELVMAPITMRGSGSGGDFEFGGAQVFRVADGRIAEVWEFRSLPEARELLS